ncbi:hypothetical protein PV797_15365 [Clostridiaceae bacterium M8S5]|nr:hypothetical protein PV797_15365 [Clostridiaceae bacterium M8S5]
MNRLFRFKPTRDTYIALMCGIIVITLSFTMSLFHEETILNKIVCVILRDILMILVVGIGFTLYYILINKKGSLADLGITKRKLPLSLIINVLLGVGLLMMFMKETDKHIVIDYNNIYAITYIFMAGIFEIVFIYGFLRFYFERAFGVIPAIILTAIFYSSHHAGFQPEFLKLFYVGIMYTSVIYITNNMFIMFPIFWGVGATWDVLINSTAGKSIRNTFSFIVAIIVLICMILYFLVIRYILKKNSIKSSKV